MFKFLMRNPFRNDYNAYERAMIWANYGHAKAKIEYLLGNEAGRNYNFSVERYWLDRAANSLGFKTFEKMEKYIKKYGPIVTKDHLFITGERA